MVSNERTARAALCAAFAAALASPSLAQKAVAAAGPLAGLAGAWSGAGAVTLANGERERIRCRASYDVGADGERLRQKLGEAGNYIHTVRGVGYRFAGSPDEAIADIFPGATLCVGGFGLCGSALHPPPTRSCSPPSNPQVRKLIVASRCARSPRESHRRAGAQGHR